MHDVSGIQLKIQNGEGVVHVYEVDDLGYQGACISVDSIDRYRHNAFALMPTYVCECLMEFSLWHDVVEHLRVVGD